MTKKNVLSTRALGPASGSGRVRLPPVLAALATIAAGFVVATQYEASMLEYQDALGAPWLDLFGIKIYNPANWMRWFVKWHNVRHPLLDEVFRNVAYIIMGTMAVAIIVAIVYRHFLTRDLQIATPDLHGSARFMEPDEVDKSGLVGTGEGVYVGAYTDPRTGVTKYLRHNGPEHVLTTAPTRSGKGVALCVTTMLSWPHSAVVYDKKKELWALTSGWRKSEANNSVVFINPTDSTGQSAKFNPLEEIRVGTPDEVGDVQNIAQMVVDPDGKGMADHWAKTGHELLSAGILHVLYAERNKTLRGLVSFFCDPSCTMEQVAEIMMQTEHDPEGKYGWLDPISGEPTRTHPMIAEAARSFLNKSDNERSGVQSTAMSFLTLYRDPIIANNTSRSDFKVQDLMLADKPVTLYIVDDPRDSDRIRPFIRLLVSQIVQNNLRTLSFDEGRPVPNYKHRLLLLFDEFPALGKLEIFQTQLAYIAGYGMKAYLIIQDKAQLDDKYGDKEAITSNCHVRNYYAPNKIETAENISKMLGTSTVLKEKVSYSGRRSKSTLDNISVSLEEVSRPLMTPDEVMRLKGPVKQGGQGLIVEAGEMLIQLAGARPIRGVQPLYFRDPTFSARAKIPMPSESDRLRPESAPSQAGNITAPIVPTAPPVEASSAAVRQSLAAAQAAAEDVDALYGESPELPDSALADYGPDPEDQDGSLASRPLPDAALLVTDDDEPEVGAEYSFAQAELDNTPDLDEDEAAWPEAVQRSLAAPAPGRTVDPMLAAMQAFAAGMSLPAAIAEPSKPLSGTQADAQRHDERPSADGKATPEVTTNERAVVPAAGSMLDPYAMFDELAALATPHAEIEGAAP